MATAEEYVYRSPACYENRTDEELVSLYQQHEDIDALECITHRYKSFVRAKARAYFLIGADREDIIQEGMIGFYKAIRDYRKEKAASFHVFAELCITRQIITAIKTATRQKHIPLNSYVSLYKPVREDDSERTLLEVIAEGASSNPEDLLISRENRELLETTLNDTLSRLEREVLNFYLQGKSYQEIAEQLDRSVKSVDNALQRIKHKIERFMDE